MEEGKKRDIRKGEGDDGNGRGQGTGDPNGGDHTFSDQLQQWKEEDDFYPLFPHTFPQSHPSSFD
jgi:hypothetical protein